MNFIPLNGWPQLKEIPEQLEHFREVYARFAKVNRWYQSIEETELTGNPVIFEKALKLNATALSVEMLPIQSGSGDPSPTNVRPISGRTAVNINHTTATCDFEQGTLSSTDGSKTNNNKRIRTKDLIPYVGGDIIIDFVNKQNTDILRAMFWYDSSKTYISNYTPFQSEFPYVYKEEDVPNNAAYIMLVVQSGDGSTDITPDGRVFDYLIPIAIQLGQTVYGGSLDVKRGALTITWVIVDMGSLIWSRHGTYTDIFVSADLTDKALGNFNLISSSYKTSEAESLAGMQNDEIKGNTTYVNVYVKDNNYTDAEAFKTAVTGQTICYELATPTTVQLTGEELEMLKGYNYISTDADSLTVKAYTI